MHQILIHVALAGGLMITYNEGLAAMEKRGWKRSEKTGLPAGTLIHVGEQKISQPRITVMEYNADVFSERTVSAEELARIEISDDKVVWINIDGIHDPSFIGLAGERFNLHPLHLEDVLNTAQRPKVDNTDQYIFIIMKMLHLNRTGMPVSEQVSIFLGKNYVITFQEDDGGDSFDGVRTRLRDNRTSIRKMHSDFLFYSLIDSLVDMYFLIIEDVSTSVSDLEDEVAANPGKTTAQSILKLKKEIMVLNRAVWPLRDIVRSVERNNNGIISDGTLVYLKDVADHVFEISETIGFSQEMVTSLMDIYLSSVNNRMNEVMKVLTVISSIFIPLTFLVGVYGMNFENMPELKSRYGYFVLLGVMFAIAAALFAAFRKKKWI